MYVSDPLTALRARCGLLVLTLEDKRIAAITNFIGSSVLPRIGLPRTLRL